MKKLLLLSVSLPTLMIAAPAIAQDSGQDIDEVTVVGSRVKGRTALDSSVPVDVIQVAELAATPSLNMKDAMTAVSPSYSVDRDSISDGDSLVRSSSLRGLNQGEVLTLLNGKRMHRNAIITYAGWQAADVGSLSVNALKSIAILRDGAAAQYGADAVAGVVDLTLDDSEGISGTALFSQYYAGDGFAYNVSSKVGVSLADRGFLTITAGYGKTDPTDRATYHLLAQDQIDQYAVQQANGGVHPSGFTFNDPMELNAATVAPYGVNEESLFTLTWNSEIEVGENSKLYAFGNFARKHHKEPFNYRAGLPTGYSMSGVGGNSGASRPVTYSYNDYVYLYGPQQAEQYKYLLTTVDAAGTVNPLGPFSGLGTHPNGYNPWFEMDMKDLGVYAGLKGEFDNGLTYDLWGSIGRSRVDNYISDTHNPSLGGSLLPDGSGVDYANVQTSFYIGSQINIERQVGLDFVYTVDTDSVENINVAFGAQYRTEQYKNVVGEKNSWLKGPLGGPNLAAFALTAEGIAAGVDGGRGLNVGSDGFGGFSPDTYFNASRSNYAIYADVDTDVTADFNIDIAARYEDFTDFGDTFSWKIASRYQLIEQLAVRGAVSTGFHAPTVAQINNTQVRTGFRADGSQTQTGTFTSDSVPGQVFGIQTIGPELARNLSFGFVFTPTSNTNITVDFFQIKLRNSLGSTPTFDVFDYPAEFAAIAASGFQGASTLTGVNFPTNQGSRRVRGLEIVAQHSIELDNSTLKLTAAYAHIKTKFLEHHFSDRSLFNAERGTAPHKATFTGNWNMDNWSVMGRARYWSTRQSNQGLDANGVYIGSNQPLAAYRIDSNPGRVFFDMAITYDVNEQFSVTLGANNLLNTYPLAQPAVYETSQKRGRQYLPDGVDWQGGQYYARVSANF